MLQGRVDMDDRDVGISNKVILNVGGIRHETYVSTLRNIPDTRLHSLTNNNPTQLPEFDPNSGEFFFDRHPIVFAQILNYYRTGKLHCPNDVCGPLFEEELAFWGLEDAGIETCCWMNYKKHGEAQANLSSFDKIVDEVVSEPDYGFADDGNSETRSYRERWRRYQSRIWVTLEEPSTSVKAKVLGLTTMFLIIASVLVTCLETVEYFSEVGSLQNEVIKVAEVVCIIWFTIEFIIRITVCPSKREFAKKIMNWLDLAAIFPFYIQLFLPDSKDVNTMVTLRIIRLIRVFRVFKLCRHSYSLQILGHTLKSSLSELFLLGFFLSIGIVVFSSLMYFAESESEKTKFTSIPAGFWWAVITMTTVGYGDFVPTNWLGRIVGTCCAVCGVLTVALPIPVIVSNFSLYYSHAKARQKSLKKKRPLVIGAANALKVIEPFLGPRPMYSNARSWPTVALEMAGISFEGSDASPNPSRRVSCVTTPRPRRWSNFTNQEQTWSQGTNQEQTWSQGTNQEQTWSQGTNQEQTSSQGTNQEPTWPQGTNREQTWLQGTKQEPTWSQSTNQEQMWSQSTNKELTWSQGTNKERTWSHDTNQEETVIEIEDDAKVNKTYNEGGNVLKDDEAGNNEGISSEFQNKEYKLPTIEIYQTSSCSQRSCSESEHDETVKKRRSVKRKRSNKKSRKTKFSVDNGTESTQPPPPLSRGPAGRMGRRDSVFVVGFIGKKWMAKAAKSRSKQQQKSQYSDFLTVSPNAYSRNNSTFDTASICTATTGMSTPAATSPRSPTFHHQFPAPKQQHLLSEPRFDRRSSCPAFHGNVVELCPNIYLSKPPLKPWKSSQSYSTSDALLMSYVNPAACDMQEETKCSNEKRPKEKINTCSGSGTRYPKNDLKDPRSHTCTQGNVSNQGHNQLCRLFNESNQSNKPFSLASNKLRQQSTTHACNTCNTVQPSSRESYGASHGSNGCIQPFNACHDLLQPSRRSSNLTSQSGNQECNDTGQPYSACNEQTQLSTKNTSNELIQPSQESDEMGDRGRSVPGQRSSTDVQGEEGGLKSIKNESPPGSSHELNQTSTQNSLVEQDIKDNTDTRPQQSRLSQRRNVPDLTIEFPVINITEDTPIMNYDEDTTYQPHCSLVTEKEYLTQDLMSCAVPKKDSGIYSGETMSSVVETFNFSDDERGMMTINNVEKKDLLQAGCILRLPFLDSCEKNTNFGITIKDETVV